MGIRADVLEVSRVLGEASRMRTLSVYEPPQAVGADARVYAALVKKLPRHEDVPGALRTAGFRPLFLVNGLVVAASLKGAPRSALLRALAAGLLEFADYFELLALRTEEFSDEDDRRARSMQPRYFAYCLARLVERSVPLTAVFATMKGDAWDDGTAEEIRRWMEAGPKAMAASPLLPEAERKLWAEVFTRGQDAWPALREHLEKAYALPRAA